jgi:hypothetical protein
MAINILLLLLLLIWTVSDEKDRRTVEKRIMSQIKIATYYIHQVFWVCENPG